MAQRRGAANVVRLTADGRRALSFACWLALSLWLVCRMARAADLPPGPPVAPTVPAVKVDQPPRIDGRLDDACWQSATHITGFWRMENSAPEYEPTEAWICYDRERIYVAWYCHDSQPNRIVAQQKKRGGSLQSDDWVGIDLDVDFDKQSPYWFDVSAGGCQVESIPGGSVSKIEWRGDWQAATTRVKDGWQAEMALPLSIFRYPKGQTTFGFVLIRRLSREDDWSVWPAIGSQFELTREAAWTGLDLPMPRRRPVLMPYLLAEVGDTENEGFTAGLDAKYLLPKGLQSMFSYNPDFRDIEDVVESIDFTYVERYLPEYRPFFLEGGGYQPYSTIFYSRRIQDFDAGVKLFGNSGRHAVGALATAEFGDALNLAVKDQYGLTPCHDLTLSFVQHRAPGEPLNLAYGLDTDQRFPKADGETGYWVSWMGSRTEGPGGDGRHAGAGWRRERPIGLSYDVGWDSTSLGFQPALGYVPETDVHSTWLDLNHRRRYESGPVLERMWFANLSQGAASTGPRWHASVDHFVNRRDQRGLWLGAGAGSRDGFPEYTLSATAEWCNRDIYRNGSLGLSWGERLRQPYRYASLSAGRQLADRLSARLTAERAYSSELDENGNPTAASSRQQYVLGLTYDVTWEKSVGARLVTRDDGTNWYLAYRQRVRSGADVWMIVGDPNAARFTRRLAVKLVRVL
jgi:hypothetical protein